MPSLPVDRTGVRERERRRLARDLHDECGQQLTALRLHLQHLSRRAAGSDFADDIARIAGLTAALDRSLSAIARDLHPPALSLGLAVALDRLTARWGAEWGVRVDTHGIEGCDRGVAPGMALHLYRAAQEALHNVGKHARASSVMVRVDRTAAELRLTISDDGCGFAPETGSARRLAGGLGLVSLQERAEAIQGHLVVSSRLGHGTTVELTVPLPAPVLNARRSAAGLRAYPAAPAVPGHSTRTTPTPAPPDRAR